jgi:hypothetical protein
MSAGKLTLDPMSGLRNPMNGGAGSAGGCHL